MREDERRSHVSYIYIFYSGVHFILYAGEVFFLGGPG